MLNGRLTSTRNVIVWRKGSLDNGRAQRGSHTLAVRLKPFWQASHGRIAYEEAGQGRPVLCLHGMNGSTQSWSEQLSGLSGEFRVVSWDAPGFGESDPCGASLDAYGKAVAELMDGLDLRDAIVVGHSMGGLVATKLAADRNPRVAGIVLSSTHLGYARPPGEPLMERYAGRMNHLMRHGGGPEYGMTSARKMVPADASERAIAALAAVAAGARFEGMRDAGRALQEADNGKIAPRVSVPVALFIGGRDPVVKADQLQGLKDAFPEALQTVFPLAGHASYVEFPELYNDALRKFAATLPAFK